MYNILAKLGWEPLAFDRWRDPRQDNTGDWDSMVLARVKDRSDLDDLTKTVFTLDGITRSYTHVVLNTVKERGVNLPPQDR